MPKVNFWYAGFIDPHNHSASETPQAAYAGLKRLGYDINHISPAGYRASSLPNADINVIYGMRGQGKEIIDAYLKRGIPSVVIDLGYIRRAMKSNGYNGYWQVSLNGLNWIPQKSDNDRFKKLGIDYPKPIKRKGYVLIAEQTPNDASHGMGAFEIEQWSRVAVTKCKKLGLDYVVRRHPQNKYGPASQLTKNTIEDALAGASCVYVHNSNTGNDALLSGIPVICDENSRYLPTYHGIVGHELNETIKFPSVKTIKDYLNRLSYAQWSREEIESGEAFEYIMSQIPAHV